MPAEPLPAASAGEQHVVVVGLARAVADDLAHLGTPTHLVPVADEQTGDLVRAAALVVVDAAAEPDALVDVLALAAAAGVRVVLEPTGPPTARAVVLGRHPVHTVVADQDGLAALTGLATTTDEEVDAAVEAVLQRDVEVVWVRRPGLGSVVGRSGHRGTSELGPGTVGAIDGPAGTAAYCRALLGGADPREALLHLQ